jgi:hypothetical protein
MENLFETTFQPLINPMMKHANMPVPNGAEKKRKEVGWSQEPVDEGWWLKSHFCCHGPPV